MILLDLCGAAGLECPTDAAQIAVEGICTHTGKLTAGQLFVALRGKHADGHDFLIDAKSRGACAAVIDREFAGNLPTGLPVLRVDSTRAAHARLLDAWYGNPSAHMQFLGVTGTNGKTSVAWMLYGLLRQAQIPCALIGTVCCEGPCGALTKDTEGMTTPEPERLYPMLAALHRQGTQIVVMEVTSHALAQQRCAPIHFSLGIFTNITRDHLDYHGSMEAYVDAKKQLLGQCERVLLNVDDERVAALQAQSPCPVLTCSVKQKQADYRAEAASVAISGVQYQLTSAKACMRIACRMGGQFALPNSLQAAVAGLLLGLKAQDVRDGMVQVLPVPGRMEQLALPAGVPFSVIIDYAHTPDALENLLAAVRKCKTRAGRVVLVFGCGGDRDQGKRAQMGQIASRMADYFVITADNSRTEALDAILADIVRGVDRRAHYRVLRDRESAIRHVIEHARAGDVILLAGKGHEQYELTENEKRPFDERAIVECAVREYWKRVFYQTDIESDSESGE